jgi:hypothetical protein
MALVCSCLREYFHKLGGEDGTIPKTQPEFGVSIGTQAGNDYEKLVNRRRPGLLTRRFLRITSTLIDDREPITQMVMGRQHCSAMSINDQVQEPAFGLSLLRSEVFQRKSPEAWACKTNTGSLLQGFFLGPSLFQDPVNQPKCTHSVGGGAMN